jgi:putative acetyltransferase
VTIRPAEPRDAEAIGGVHRAAFPTPAEADLIEALTREGDATVSLVAERQGEVVDHVLLSRMRVSGDGRARRAVGLGPVGVRPAFRAAASARA